MQPREDTLVAATICGVFEYEACADGEMEIPSPISHARALHIVQMEEPPATVVARPNKQLQTAV